MYRFCLLFHSLALNDNAVNEEIARTFNITPPFRLEDFTYSNHKLLEIMFRHLEKTSFNGITVCLIFWDERIVSLCH